MFKGTSRFSQRMAGSRSIHLDRAAYLAEEEAKYLVRVEWRARKRREAYERSPEGQQALREAAEAETRCASRERP